MLQTNSIAKFLTDKFNEHIDLDIMFYKIQIHDGAYDDKNYKNKINAVLTLLPGEQIKTVMNYIKVLSNYELEFHLPLSDGYDEITGLNMAINEVIKDLNGKLQKIDGGQAIFNIKMPSVSGLANRHSIGESVLPKINIEVEFSIRKSGLKYEMALIDNIFDDGTVNARYFNSQEEQIAYYNDKVTSCGAPYCELMSPNTNSLILTQQSYINDISNYPDGTEEPLELNEILQKNYAIIRAMDGDIAVGYYYYFVQSARVGENNQALLDLKMDTIQTWLFNPDIEFSDCIINRAHLNRFIDNGDGTVKFDCSKDSNLHKIEPLNYNSLCIVNSSKLITRYTLNDSAKGAKEFNKWLDENVAFWIYYYVMNKEYTLSKKNESGTIVDYSFIPSTIARQEDGGTLDVSCFCCPVYKTSKLVMIKTSRYSEPKYSEQIMAWSSDSFYNKFKEKNKNNEYIVDIKVSHVCPLEKKFYTTDISDLEPSYDNVSYYLDNGNLVIEYHSGGSGFIPEGKNIPISVNGFLEVAQENAKYCVRVFSFSDESWEYKVKTKNISFAKSSLINCYKNKNFEPKLLQKPFSCYRLTDGTTNYYDYDILKIGELDTILYNESFAPGANRGYARFKGNNDLIYNQFTETNLNGLIINKLQDLPVVTDNYSTYLAQNKNALLTGLVLPLAESAISSAGGIALASMTGGLSAVAGAGIAGNSLLNAGNTALNYLANIDNLKNSPSVYKDGGHNVLFQNTFKDLGLYLEEYCLINKEVKEVYEFLYKHGYSYNEIGNIKDYLKIRKYFNFIQAEVENINGVSVSNEIREDLRLKFRNGVRFWNDDNIQYNLENYEIWLEEIN